MQSAPLFLSQAPIGIPSAGQCLPVLAPIAALVALYLLLTRLDRIVHRLFPSLEWERQLGWLNIRAERHAMALLRGFSYVVYVTLIAALCGMVWGAIGLRLMSQWNDPAVLDEINTRVTVLCPCLAYLLFYFAAMLIPKLRREYEHEELERYRAKFVPSEDTNSLRARYSAAKRFSKPSISSRPWSQR